MKIEKINENKIKVLIDIDEAKEWNVNIKNIASNTPEIQEMFWTALRLAEKDVEFSVDGAKLFVEAIPGQTEGFGMLITKIFSDNDLNLAVSNCSYKGRVKKRKLTPGRNECIKRFARLQVRFIGILREKALFINLKIHIICCFFQQTALLLLG